MTNSNPHLGSSFESWLDEQGLREEVTAAAIKSLLVRCSRSEGGFASYPTDRRRGQ